MTSVMVVGLILLYLGQAAVADSIMLTVNADMVLRDGADHFVGINLNYIRDLDANHPLARPMNTALKSLGVSWLRYPGGEKSDYYLWSTPPYDRPRPTSLGNYVHYAGQRMDFDQYMQIVRNLAVEPYIVVGYDKSQTTGRTKAQWIENAVSWVTYANVTKKLNVKYWEIGNENWYNGTAKPAEMAKIVTEFSHAMKAADPAIQIGASVSDDNWMSQFLPAAAHSLDFITVSLYNCKDWKNYDRFIQQPAPDLVLEVKNVINAIDRYVPAEDRARLRIVVAETNSKDFSKDGWPGFNNLGHALVLFDTLGRLMENERVLSAMVWTTRWMNDEEAQESQWYALGSTNQTLPTGYAVALWGQFIQKKLVSVGGKTEVVSAYAGCSEGGQHMSVWILNKGYQSADKVCINIKSLEQYHHATVFRLSGIGPNDPSPTWAEIETGAISSNQVDNLVCPGLSVTVVSLNTRNK